jgi:hypothetical protein
MRLIFIASIICLTTVQSLYAQGPVVKPNPLTLCRDKAMRSHDITIAFGQELPFAYSFEIVLDDTFFIRGKCLNLDKHEPLFITRKSKAGLKVLSDGSSPYPADFYCTSGNNIVVPSILYKKPYERPYLKFAPKKIKLTLSRPGQEDLKAERVLVPEDRDSCEDDQILWRVN